MGGILISPADKSALAELQRPNAVLPNTWLFLRFPPSFGLIMRFFCLSDPNFTFVDDARKAGFAPYMCLAYRCPGRRWATIGENLVT